MAKLSARGRIEVGTIVFVAHSKRYMSDGVVLKNSGHGWKVSGKVKDGVTPEQAFANAKAKHEALLNSRPLLAAYRKELHELAGLSKRWKLHLAVTTMPDDADGVWSEACDGYGDNISADVDEISKLCMLYKLALKETEELKAEATAAA